MKRFLVLMAAIAVLAMPTGCTPRVRVVANPTPHQKGIRYYRPKPYLLVSSGVAEMTVSDKEKTTTTRMVPDSKVVNIQLVYMPDFEEEYAIDVRTGFGTADVSITLEDGWNLTAINQKLDSQTDENLKGVAELLGAIGSLPAPTAQKGERSLETRAAATCNVKATNVPLGYYESVIGRDGMGRKRLYGFRYLGFLPYASCPQSMQGLECGNCETADLYGLVFENDTMVFRRLHEIQTLGGETQFDMSPGASEPVGNTATVLRQIEYDDKGDPTKAKVSVSDEFQVPTTRDNVLYVPLPKLKMPRESQVQGVVTPSNP
jgi:hypothetical protein